MIECPSLFAKRCLELAQSGKRAGLRGQSYVVFCEEDYFVAER